MRRLLPLLVIAIVAWLVPAVAGAAEPAGPLKVIFDTDMDGDNDDVAAAAILHAFADAGRVQVLAMGVVSRCPHSPAWLDAINTYYGRGDIPIGVYKGTALAEVASPYARVVAERCPNDIGPAERVPDALRVYRRALAAQPDGTVTMIAVGPMNNLVDLLHSPPDDDSPLAGRELVRRKVAALFVMGPYFNEQRELQRAYNFTTSPKAALELVEHWPTKIKFGEGILGHRHSIGGRLAETPADNPVRIAFEAYFAEEKRSSGKTETKRHCADPATVLYAVTGTQYFGEVGPGACEVRENGFTRWDASRDKQHFYNTQKLAVGELEEVMEKLLVKPPERGKRPARAAAPRTVTIGGESGQSRVPPPLRRGSFLSAQAVAAVDIGDDGQSVAVGTMAFRHDRNFFLLSSAAGKILSARYVEPWAPAQVAALAREGGDKSAAFAAAMAYARQTEPFPVVSLFRDAREKEAAAVDDVGWDRGVLRYGGGEWRTGWTASVLGDLFARGRGSVFTVGSPDGTAWRWGTAEAAAGKPARFALPGPRPFRMTASTNGCVLALAYLVPDVSTLEVAVRGRLQPEPPGLVTAVDAETAKALWSAAPMADTPPAPQLPEPADDFPDLAGAFNMKPQALVPFRVAASVSAGGDGSRVAVTEYAGWLRVRRERLIGYWSGHGQAVAFCPREQRGWLRVFGPGGKPVAQGELPRDGLFDVRLSLAGNVAWCVPASWFARGTAGCAWLPADGAEAHTVFVYDVARQAWSAAWRFPDAIAEFVVHPDGQRALASCWDGRVYLVGRDGTLQARVNLGGPARLRWSGDGSFAVAATEAGDVLCLSAGGEVRWKTALPVADVPRLTEPPRRVFEEVPVYSVGRVGPEHAYVGDTWLIKTDQGGILVDAGGTSGIPLTLERIRAAGVEPGDIRYVLLSHSHGDHLNAVYLWRARGAEVVAPASAAFASTWVVPQWNGYGVSVPCPIDRPLPLRRAGDEAEITLCGVRVKAVFVPGHSVDSVVYFLELNGRRVIFSGDIAFDDRRAGFPVGSNILHRCWADREKAKEVVRVIEEKVLPLRPEFEFKGHASHRDALAAWRNILEATRKALEPTGAAERPAAR